MSHVSGCRRSRVRALLAALAATLFLTGLAAPAAHAAPPAGTALSWGFNLAGQLGNGTTTSSDVPVGVHLPAGTRVTAVAAANFHALALTSDGRVLAWGVGYAGQLGDGTDTGSTTPVAVDLPAGTTVTAIAANGAHSLALTSDGRVLAWGANTYGELGDGTTTDRFTPVAVHLPAGITVTAITAGYNESAALTSDGRLYAWGRNDLGQLGDGTTTGSTLPVLVDIPAGTTITAVSMGSYHSLALTSDGRVLAWGDNVNGQLGNGTTTGSTTPVATLIPAGTTITAVAAGTNHSLALTSDHRVLAWGSNIGGQLGNGSLMESDTPVTVLLPPGFTVTAVAAGHSDSLALTSTGQILAWGANYFGALGDGSTIPRETPILTDLPEGARATAIAAGRWYSLAVVEEPSSTTTLTASPTTVTKGQPVTLTAEVTCDLGTPTGEVTFYSGDTPIGSAPVGGDGRAEISVSDLGVGTHQVTAHYAGDAICPASVSAPVTITVNAEGGGYGDYGSSS
ncbi:Ig-like domain repeat protein [Streptomyces sp. NPDC048717]|uniref:RCC1 domain-containing protein n=1 Tax=Streptomyces sp. NPDC048717 TaxID=3154928 RepID=UPI003431687E